MGSNSAYIVSPSVGVVAIDRHFLNQIHPTNGTGRGKHWQRDPQLDGGAAAGTALYTGPGESGVGVDNRGE